MTELPESNARASTIWSDAKPNEIQFKTKEKGVVGTLHLHPPMRFEGDADESARAFFECLIARIKKEN